MSSRSFKTGWQVVGIDFAPRAIQIAKRKIKNANIQADLRVGDATQLNGIDGPFDLALDMGCFHGIEKRKDYLDSTAPRACCKWTLAHVWNSQISSTRTRSGRGGH